MARQDTQAGESEAKNVWLRPAIPPEKTLLGQVQAAERLGISLNRLNEIVLGKRGITADMALRLGRLLKTSPQLWMRLQADWDLHQAIVAERRGEIGIRMALGAQRLGVLAHVMKEGLVLAAIAVAVGLAAAYVLSGLIASLLFGVRPVDVPTAAAVAGTMIIVAAVACLLPAWRASRLDPIAALRAIKVEEVSANYFRRSRPRR